MRKMSAVVVTLLLAAIGLVLADLLSRPETRAVTLPVVLVMIPFAEVALFIFIFRIAWKLSPSSAEPLTMLKATKNSNWVDSHVDLREDDNFQRLSFAMWFAKVIERVHGESSSSVIGLVGPWGAGKTSVLDSAVRELGQGAQTWSVVRLNPWRYVSADALVAGFFGELRNALPQGSRWSEAREALGQLLETAAGFGSITSPLGLDSSALIRATASGVRRGSTASRAEARAREALSALAHPVLVVIDDVDRLEPTELTRLLQLVRALGRLPYVHYVLSYDESSVLETLVRSDLVGGEDAAGDFMEKIVQVRFDVPPLRRRQADPFVDAHLEQLMAANGVSPNQQQQYRFANIYQEHLARRLVTPRSILRWLAHIRLLYPTSSNPEVDFFDFVLVVWLRITYPNIALMLQEHKSDIFPTTWHRDRSKEADSRQLAWERRLRLAGVADSDVSGLYQFLGQLFPSIDDDRLKAHTASDLDHVRRRLGVGHSDYFERYFGHGVPEEEMSESDFAEVMTEVIRDGAPSEKLAAFERVLRERATETAWRVEEYASHTPDAKLPLLRLLLRNFGSASDAGLFSSQDAIRGTVHRLLRDSDDRPELLRVLLSEPEIAVEALQAAGSLGRREGEENGVGSPVVGLALEYIRSYLGGLEPNGPIRSWPREVWNVLWVWFALDVSSLRTWYRERAEEDGDVRDALAAISTLRRISGVADAPWLLAGVEDNSVESYLGLDWVREKLSRGEVDLSGDPIKTPDFGGGPSDTWENRRGVALDWLQRFDAQREDGDAEANRPR